MQLPKRRCTALLLLLAPAAWAGRALRGADNKDDPVSVVYKLKPCDITDEQLEALVVEPKIKCPDADKPPDAPPQRFRAIQVTRALSSKGAFNCLQMKQKRRSKRK